MALPSARPGLGQSVPSGDAVGRGRSSRPARVPTSQPAPTNPYNTPSVPMGNGGSDINPAPGMPPGGTGMPSSPSGGNGNIAPTNPKGTVSGNPLSRRG